jgi:hypothetical protein
MLCEYKTSGEPPTDISRTLRCETVIAGDEPVYRGETVDKADLPVLVLVVLMSGSLVAIAWSQSGSLTVPLADAGRSLDVFTQKGGIGSFRPSESFLPQEEVVLYALATYNQEPLPGRLVAFDVYYPWGELYLTRTAMTNGTGIATVSFQLPWLPHDPAFYVGIWAVNAATDIASEVTRDTLVFGYGVLLGDVNYDGMIDILDCVLIAAAFGATPSDPDWNLSSDVNRDNLVDVYDMIFVSIDFGAILT